LVDTPRFHPDNIAPARPGLWRYRAFLPLADDAHLVSMGEGWTPLIASELAGRRCWLKLDHLFPTGSYKDRGATALISRVRELGIRRVVEDSSGNAGSAIAAYCALAGIRCRVLVPAHTSPAKLAQIRLYGADLQLVPGSREATAQAVLAEAQSTYYASHSWNPLFLQGTKTVAYEVCEQLGWRAPDALVLPVGNGTLLLGAAIGLGELLEAGVIAHLPRLVAVQAAACAPLARRFAGQAEENDAAPEPTLAEGIAIAEPVRGGQILEAVRRSGGTFLTVAEDELKQALHTAARRGLLVEPTAAAALAGLRQYLATSDDTCVVAVVTGHGLKAADKLLDLEELR
jgi:threonine synthase